MAMTSRTVLAILCFACATSQFTASRADDLFCNFETKCHGLEWDKAWNLTQANTSVQGRFDPPEDHTYGNSSGHYLYLNRTNYEAIIFTSELKMENTSKCFEFYYVSNGKGFHYLHVTLDAGTLRENWFNTTNGNETNWQRGIVELPEDTYTIRMRANVSLESGFVAIDDVRIYDCKKNSTPPAPPAEPLLTCHFEKDSCAFGNDTWNELEWFRSEADSAHRAKEARPMTDHTTGTKTGHYVFIESTNRHLPNEDGRFVSSAVEVPNDNSTYCVELFYYSYAKGSFHVFNVSDPEYIDEVLVVNFTGQQAQWTRAIYPVAPGNLTLALTAIVPEQGKVGMAVDDVRVYRCPFVRNPASRPRRLLSQLDCDFESSTCGLVSPVDFTARWTRVSAKNTTIPTTGHPTPGHFMIFELVEEAIHPEFFTSVLLTPDILGRPRWCTDFYYYIHNPTNATLAKNSIEFRLTQGSFTIFNKDDGNLAKRWQHAMNVPIVSDLRTQLTISAKVYIKELLVAIDDLKIGPCASVSPTSAPTTPVQSTTTGTVIMTTTVTTTTSTYTSTVTSERTTHTIPKTTVSATSPLLPTWLTLFSAVFLYV